MAETAALAFAQSGSSGLNLLSTEKAVAFSVLKNAAALNPLAELGRAFELG